MRHSIVIVALIVAVIGEGWAQNRGSVRYAPPSEEFDGDITRAPRPAPTRGASVRRTRPTKAPEPVDEEPKAYQPPNVPPRTTGRRVPQRSSQQNVAPPPPQTSPVLEEDTAARYPTAEEEPQVPLTKPEGRPPGIRRRRPMKRRRPQNVLPKEVEEPEKQALPARGEENASILDLINEDRKRTDLFPNSPTSRNNPSIYVSDPVKAALENDSPAEQVNAAGPEYFRPQPPTNRLPVGDSEPVGNSRGYLDAAAEGPAPYAPERSNDASYVPVLNPNRVPSEGASRLPSNDYTGIHSPSRPASHSDLNVPLRGHGHRPPVVDPKEIIRDTNAKPVLNVIPESDVPVRSHSEVRLPENEQPDLVEYIPPSFDSEEDTLATNPEDAAANKEPSNPTNRLPNPSEIHYNSAYPEYSDYSRGHQTPARRRQELPESSVHNPPISTYSAPRRDSGTKPQEYDNDAEVDRQQTSRYRPPLERGGSRYKAENLEESTRSRTQEHSPSTSAPRTRGSSRYQSPESEYAPERLRSTTGTRSETTSDSSSRSRSPTPSQSSTRARGSQRYVPKAVASTGPRTNAQRQNTAEVTRAAGEQARSSSGYDDLVKDELRPNTRNTAEVTRVAEHARSSSSGYDDLVKDELRPNTRRQNTAEVTRVAEHARSSSGYDDLVKDELRPNTRRQNTAEVTRVAEHARSSSGYDDLLKNAQQSSNVRSESQPKEYGSVRNTLRSGPQYEVREEEPLNSYEESVEEDDAYNPYLSNRQANTRGRTNQGAAAPVQPPEPEYHLPPNRQQSRPHYEPQNPRSRQQPQYVAPQNPRTDSRQTARRQNTQPQGRTRHQNPEPAPSPRRPSAGGSNFKCPDGFGFFADPVQCDKYYECRNGTAEMNLCNDGLAFNEISAPKFLRCDSLRDVDCKSRPELQEAQPTKNCPRKYGLFPHETDCTKFWNCVDGVSTEVQCPPGLTYNDERATCDWADLVETSCKTEDLLGFTCPEPTAHDLLDGVYTRYPHPDNCQLHFTCIKGADGTRRPRMLSCNEGSVFDPASSSCKRPEEVPGCEDFYGVRSPPPKRKPSRQPEPEPEEIPEEAPRPRRRGSNRRTRN